MNKSILKVILVTIPLLASVPAMAQFQSTSTMAGSGSAYASDPTLGADGSATYSTAAPNRGRTATMAEGDVIVPPGQGDKDNKITDPTPIGSALPALLLLAGAYAGVVAIRRRRQQA